MIVRKIDELVPGFVKLEHDRWGPQIWHKVKVRKATTCYETGINIKKGDEAYRTLGNTMNRMDRLSAFYVESL